MAREIPGAELIEYKGVGHMTALEAPDALARDVLSFIASHPAGAGARDAPDISCLDSV
jgi:hypothetical protein